MKIEIAVGLRYLEDDLWEFIVKLSRQLIGAKSGVGGVTSKLSEEQKNVIKFETQGKNPTLYEFGALS